MLKCAKCQQAISGTVEQLTAIVGPNRKGRRTRPTWHFHCFYPTAPVAPLPLPVVTYNELAALDPIRAGAFYPDASDQL